MNRSWIPIALSLSLALPLLARDPLPAELKTLQEKHDQKIREIDMIYAIELEKLKIKFTKAGNIEAAVAAETLLKQLEITKVAEAKIEHSLKMVAFKKGSAIFTNRKYRLTTAPEEFADYSVSLSAGGGSSKLTFKVEVGGTVTLLAGEEDTALLVKDGWEKVAEVMREPEEKADSRSTVLQKELDRGDYSFGRKTFLGVRLVMKQG